MHVGPLSKDDVGILITDRAGSVPSDTVSRIVDASDGNPLFAEQLVAALDDDVPDSVPGSLRGLLTTRLDRLGPGERDVLRCASIVGTELDLSAVCALLPDEASPFVERHLDALCRKHLLERTTPNKLRFCHSLIRQAAYQSVTREDRAELHKRFAEWLRENVSDEVPELTQILDYHLELADSHRRASGMSGAAETI